MRKVQTKRDLIVLGLISLTLLLSSSEAFSWGFATHAYIDDHLGQEGPWANLQEIYGGVAPDLFNYLFDDPVALAFLSDQTHHHPLKVWKAAGRSLEKPLAHGFVSHNDLWGADYTAHHVCQKCGQTDGYAIARAKELLALAPLPPELGIPDEVAIEIFHEIVENAVDILIKRKDPWIGYKLTSSALLRSPHFPHLLARAYAKDFSTTAGISYPEAARFILSAEKEFRKTIILYGQILVQDEETATQLISEQTADLARGFLALYEIDLDLPKEAIVELVTSYMMLALQICEDDYLDEIAATIHFVKGQLKAHGITYEQKHF